MTIKIHEMDNMKLSQSIELKHKLKHLETKAFYMQKKSLALQKWIIANIDAQASIL